MTDITVHIYYIFKELCYKRKKDVFLYLCYVHFVITSHDTFVTYSTCLYYCILFVLDTVCAVIAKCIVSYKQIKYNIHTMHHVITIDLYLPDAYQDYCNNRVLIYYELSTWFISSVLFTAFVYTIVFASWCILCVETNNIINVFYYTYI